jgi:hypothetical protein
VALERAIRKGDGMHDRRWHPYPPDQQFGAQAAADALALDRLVALYEASCGPAPRAANKAPNEGRSPVPAPALTWRHLMGWPVERFSEPVTTATALAAAPLARYSDG